MLVVMPLVSLPLQTQHGPQPCQTRTHAEKIPTRMRFPSLDTRWLARAPPGPSTAATVVMRVSLLFYYFRSSSPTAAKSEEGETAIEETLDTAVEADQSQDQQTNQDTNDDSSYGAAR
jgi:hypothetical protein